MTPDRPDSTHDDDAEPVDNAVLDDAGNVDTAGIGVLGSAFTAQIPVSFAAGSDDDLDDADVVDDGVPYDDLAAMMASDAKAIEDAAAQSATPDEEVVEAEVEPVAEQLPVGQYLHAAPADDVSTGEVIIDAEPVDDAGFDDSGWVMVPVADRLEGSSLVIEVESAGDDQGAAGNESAPTSEERNPPAASEPKADAGPAPAAEPAPAAPSSRAAAPESAPSAPVSASPATVSGPVPTTRREAFHAGSADRSHDVERVHPQREEVALTSKRLDEFGGSSESSDLLTADRLLDHKQVTGPEPEGRWQHFVYTISGRRINLGDSKRVRARKEQERRIASPLTGGARFVPVLSRKGGVGKTTVTTVLGMALADGRDDRIIAIDANPDRGTLAERIARPSGRTVRDLARYRGDVNGYNDVSTIVTRDETRLDVLASDSDPRVSEAFSDRDYHDVATLAAHYYSIVLTDTGTGIVHSVMGATLELADQLVVVAGLSVDEARLASETLTWLEINGFAEQVRNAVVVLNNARPGPPLVRPSELESHFRTRVRTVVRMPYDLQIATGSVISFRDLQPATRQAARELAAAVVEGLRGLATAA